MELLVDCFYTLLQSVQTFFESEVDFGDLFSNLRLSLCVSDVSSWIERFISIIRFLSSTRRLAISAVKRASVNATVVLKSVWPCGPDKRILASAFPASVYTTSEGHIQRGQNLLVVQEFYSYLLHVFVIHYNIDVGVGGDIL